jgi:hypothetical protein
MISLIRGIAGITSLIVLPKTWNIIRHSSGNNLYEIWNWISAQECVEELWHITYATLTKHLPRILDPPISVWRWQVPTELHI